MKITDSQQILQLLTQYAREALSVGDRFTGRILAITDGLLMLQLPDGSKVNAEVKSGAEYSPGQVLRLEVVEENNGRLFVKEMTAGQVQAEDKPLDPASLLKALKLPADGNRVEIVKAMTDLGVKPSAEIIEKAVQLLESRQIAEPRQAVFLLLNKMENNEDYFPLIKQLDEKSFHFQEKLMNFATHLAQLEDDAVLALADALVTEEVLEKQDLPVLSKQITALLKPDAEPSPIPDKAISNTLKNVMQQLNLQTIKADDGDPVQHLQAKATEFKAIHALLSRLMPDFDKADKPVQEEIIKAFADFSARVLQEKDRQPLTPERAKQVILQAAREVPAGAPERENDAALPKVDQWLERTERKLQVISQALAESEGREGERLLPEIRELQTALSFFNEVTTYEAFVQLPLALKDNATQGELYVMKRKGLRKLNAEDFSLFLSLTTVNLGTIDTFVHVQKKNIMLRVMVEDEQFYPLLTNQYKALHEALKAKGFTLYELKVAPRDEGLDLFNAVKKAREITKPNTKIDKKV
jgi:hypothetical protein